MILVIDTDTADGACHPTVGERFWPVRIDEKARHVAIGRAGGLTKIGGDQSRKSEYGCKHVLPDLHDLPLPKFCVR
jgi:hypothetical protein